MKTLKISSVEFENNIIEILNILKEDGVLAIEDFLDSEVLNNLNLEFDWILNNSGSCGIHHLEYSQGKGAIIKKDSNYDSSNFSNTEKVFNRIDFRKLAESYLKNEVNLNNEIYVVKDIVGSRHHANDLHFDVTPTFKFFIYLTDTTKDNGAFSCVPGSHKKSELIRKELGDKISYENRELSRQLPVTENEVISVEGKAGTLIIFDTDVFHKAGTVHSGERKVMRGHTRKSNELNLIKNRSFFNKLKSIFSK